MNDYDPGEPTWRYRRNAFGEMESEIFGSNEIPKGEGWVDSPARIADAPKPIPKAAPPPVSVIKETVGTELHPSDPPKKRGRPRKVRDGDNG